MYHIIHRTINEKILHNAELARNRKRLGMNYLSFDIPFRLFFVFSSSPLPLFLYFSLIYLHISSLVFLRILLARLYFYVYYFFARRPFPKFEIVNAAHYVRGAWRILVLYIYGLLERVCSFPGTTPSKRKAIVCTTLRFHDVVAD